MNEMTKKQIKKKPMNGKRGMKRYWIIEKK
jgi:hypothetical protein